MEKLEKLRSLVSHFESRKKQAKERLALVSDEWWCFAVLGLSLEPDEYVFENSLILRQVKDPPGEIELAAALEDKSLMSPVARYSKGVTYEIAINISELDIEKEITFSVAWWVLSALRVRTGADVLAPMAANYSWSVISGVDDSSVEVHFIEDVPRARRFGSPTLVKAEDLDWIDERFSVFVNLLEAPKFRLAVDALTTHQHEASLRMTVATLWAGIESLFNVQQELRYRLAVYIASFLEPRGDSRIKCFFRLKKLYDYRSKVVHGAPMSDDQMIDHICIVRGILSMLLCTIVEAGELPSSEDMDALVLS